MTENLIPASVDELVEAHDSPEEVLESLREERPELPERFQDMSDEELLDLPITTGTDEEAEQLAEYLIYDREMAKRYESAKARME